MKLHNSSKERCITSQFKDAQNYVFRIVFFSVVMCHALTVSTKTVSFLKQSLDTCWTYA